MSAPTEDTQVDTELEVSSSHLDDARAAFAAAAEPEDKSVKELAKTEAAKKPEPEAKKPSPLDSLFKKKDAPAEDKSAKTEAVDEDPFKDLAQVDPKSKHAPDWAKAKEVTKSFQKRASDAENRAAQLEKEIGELRTKGVNPEADAATKSRLAQLEEENKKYSSRLKVLDFKSHPEFEAKFVAPQNDARAALKQIVEQEELQDVNLDALLSLRGKAQAKAASEVLAKLTPFNQPVFAAELRKYTGAVDAANAALADADKFLAQSTERSRNEQRAAFDSVTKDFSIDLAGIQVDEKASAEEKAEALEYNTALQSLSKTAEKLAFSPVGNKEVAEMAHKAAAYEFTMSRVLPRMQKLVEREIGARDARIQELETKLAKIKGAKPTVTEGGDGGDGPTEKPMNEMDHLEAARVAFRGVQA